MNNNAGETRHRIPRWSTCPVTRLRVGKPGQRFARDSRRSPSRTQSRWSAERFIRSAGRSIEAASCCSTTARSGRWPRQWHCPRMPSASTFRGKHVYPGLIDANSQLGLVEVPSVRGSRSTRAKQGLINPNVKAEVAVNPDSELIPVGRSGGVLTVLTVPSGGLDHGTVGLHAARRLDVGRHVPQERRRAAHYLAADAAGRSLVGRGVGRASRTEVAIRRSSRSARRLPTPRPITRPNSAHADGKCAAARIRLAVGSDAAGARRRSSGVHRRRGHCNRFKRRSPSASRKACEPVIVGGYDAVDCAALLKKHDVPVIVGGVYRTPLAAQRSLRRGLHASRAAERSRHSVLHRGRDRRRFERRSFERPQSAVSCGVGGGLRPDPEEALKAITLYPAQILGVADRVGSLEARQGRHADRYDGDPLEISTQVTAAYIQGRQVDLNDRHKRLWEKYKEKYRRLGIEN